MNIVMALISLGSLVVWGASHAWLVARVHYSPRASRPSFAALDAEVTSAAYNGVSERRGYRAWG